MIDKFKKTTPIELMGREVGEDNRPSTKRNYQKKGIEKNDEQNINKENENKQEEIGVKTAKENKPKEAKESERLWLPV